MNNNLFDLKDDIRSLEARIEAKVDNPRLCQLEIDQLYSDLKRYYRTVHQHLDLGITPEEMRGFAPLELIESGIVHDLKRLKKLSKVRLVCGGVLYGEVDIEVSEDGTNPKMPPYLLLPSKVKSSTGAYDYDVKMEPPQNKSTQTTAWEAMSRLRLLEVQEEELVNLLKSHEHELSPVTQDQLNSLITIISHESEDLRKRLVNTTI